MTSQEKNLGVGFEKRHKTRNQSRDELKHKETMMVRGPDGEMVECEIISTRDKESVFAKNAPILPLAFAIVACICNFVPGLGTWMAAIFSLCCGQVPTMDQEGSKLKTFLVTLLTGLLQLILAPLIVGILWSINYGVMLIRKSMDAKHQKQMETV